MLQSGDGDLAIGGAERPTLQLAFALQHAPTCRDGLRQRKNAADKERQQVVVKPLFKTGAAIVASRQKPESLAAVRRASQRSDRGR